MNDKKVKSLINDVLGYEVDTYFLVASNDKQAGCAVNGSHKDLVIALAHAIISTDKLDEVFSDAIEMAEHKDMLSDALDDMPEDVRDQLKDALSNILRKL